MPTDTLSAIRAFMPLLRRHGGPLTRATMAGVSAQVAATALIATAAWLLTTAAQRPNIEALMLAIVAVRGLALARGGLRYVERLTGHDAALRMLSELRASVFAGLVRAGRTRTDGRSSGDGDAELTRRLVSDVDAVQDALLRVVLPGVATVVVGMLAVGLGWSIDPRVGLTLLGFLLLTGLVLPLLAGYAERRANGGRAVAEAELATRALDLMRGADDLVASGARTDYEARALLASRQLARAGWRGTAYAALLAAVANISGGAGVLVVLWVALGSPAASTSVLPAVAALVALSSLDVAAGLVDTARTWTRCRPSLLRVAHWLPTDSPTVDARPHTIGTAPRHTDPNDDGVVLGAIGDGMAPLVREARPATVRHATVRLRGCGVRFGRDWALSEVTVDFAPCRSVAVIGASGAGKSTLLRIITGEEAPTTGEVLLGRECATGEDLGRHSRGLTDGAHVFRASIRANLLLARPTATSAELDRAADRARLGDWIRGLPDGWDSEVGDGGQALSGGQRRRLLLARAFLARPDLLVVDEPTTGLDPAESDAIVTDLLREKNVVLATHRLTPLHGADEVIVVDAGRIVQRGSPEVLARAPGRYADLLRREALSTA